MRLIIVGLLVAAALAGCTTQPDGSASIYVKDAPTDEFAEIHVLFSKVEVHRAGTGGGDGAGNGTGDGNGTDGGDGPAAGWIELWQNASGRDIDLLDASGDRAAFLGEAGVEPAKYTQLRIHVIEAYGIDHAEERHDFTVPSGVLKLNRPFEVVGGEETRIIIDFDLDESLKKSNGEWRMRPVVGSVAVDLVEDEESGADVHDEGEIASVA